MTHRFFYSLTLLLFTLTALAAQVNPNKIWVAGYYRSNGTYVKGYYRTAPNHTVNDNYSTIGNVNPHTGEKGWVPRDSHKNPYAATRESTAVRGIDNTNGGQSYFRANTSTIPSAAKFDVADLSEYRLRYVNTTRLNVRTGPGANYHSFLQAQRGANVRVINEFNAPWNKVVVYDGENYAVGYVHERYLSTLRPTAPPERTEAAYTVEKFLGYIDQGNYEIAYGLSDNPYWESLNWFSSAKAYGAVTMIRTISVALIRSEGTEALVRARYYAEDPANQTGTYEQDFYLNGDSGDWRIRKAKLINFDENEHYRPQSDTDLVRTHKGRIEAYHRHLTDNTTAVIEKYYAPWLDHYFDEGPRSKYYALENHRKYLLRWELTSLVVEPNSWVGRRVPDGAEISSTVRLKLRRRTNGQIRHFRVRQILVLNANGLIVHIDEVILKD